MFDSNGNPRMLLLPGGNLTGRDAAHNDRRCLGSDVAAHARDQRREAHERDDLCEGRLEVLDHVGDHHAPEAGDDKPGQAKARASEH